MGSCDHYWFGYYMGSCVHYYYGYYMASCVHFGYGYYIESYVHCILWLLYGKLLCLKNEKQCPLHAVVSLWKLFPLCAMLNIWL